MTSLLLDAAYGPEHREALRRLRDDVGHIVERERLPFLIGVTFPEVAAHPDFTKEAAACTEIIVSMLGLHAWENEWFVTRTGAGRLRDVRSSVDGASPERLKEILRAIGPSIRRPAELGAALIRVMPDLRRAPDHERLIARVNPNGAGRTEPKAGPAISASARVAESRLFDSASQSTDRTRKTAAGSGARWRPYWWGLLRAWSSEHGFSLQRVDNDEMARAAGYVEGVVSLLDSDEDLAFHHWKEGFRRPSGMTDVHRIDVHAHIIHQAIGRIRASKKRDRAAVPPPYVDAVKKAFFLGLDDDVVDVAIAGRLQRPTTIALTRGLRVKATVGPGRPLDEVLEIHELVADHARALGMSHDGTVSRATDLVAVTRWNLRSRAVARALRYRIPIVLIDDFLAAGLRDEIAGREIGFAAQRAAICGRCGIVHAFPARRIHRKDALCQGCR